jgi:glycosyltransferase involved in cell wall biosynthesis
VIEDLKTENETAPFGIIHTLGAPIDFNGNISRILGESIHVARLGIDVTIVVSNQVPKTCFEQAADNGVKLSLLNPPFPSKGIGWRLNNILPLFAATLKAICYNQNSILHVSAPSPVTKPFTGLILGKQLKKPIVLDLHDPWSEDLFSLNPLLMLQTNIMRFVINKADLIIVAHNQLAKLVKSLNNKKPLALIPNCVDSTLYQPTERNKLIAKGLEIADDEIVIAFCGHVTEFKGLDVLIRSAKIVLEKCKNTKFLIIGDGPFLQPAKDLASKLGVDENFEFVGFIPQKLLPTYLSLADVCVAPYKPAEFYKLSLPETPIKVVEYMSMGKPVIMSKISDENVISWSGGGVQITPGDVNELASWLISLISDEEMRRTLGRKGRVYVEQNLSWEKMAPKLVELYKSLY